MTTNLRPPVFLSLQVSRPPRTPPTQVAAMPVIRALGFLILQVIWTQVWPRSVYPTRSTWAFITCMPCSCNSLYSWGWLQTLKLLLPSLSFSFQIKVSNKKAPVIFVNWSFVSTWWFVPPDVLNEVFHCFFQQTFVRFFNENLYFKMIFNAVTQLLSLRA